jgi:hypothetical protein
MDHGLYPWSVLRNKYERKRTVLTRVRDSEVEDSTAPRFRISSSHFGICISVRAATGEELCACG